MKNYLVLFTALVALGSLYSRKAHAISYYELETYGYETASQGETELENFSSVGSIFRSSVELNYGLSDRVELAAYSDFNSAGVNSNVGYAGARTHVRTKFFEKGQLPVDLGAYAELEFPRNDRAQIEGEIRGIIERDFGRLTLDINPIFEKVLKGEGGFVFSYATKAAYRLDQHWKPHFDTFGGFEDGGTQLILSSAVDYRVNRSFVVSASAGFGVTSDTPEKTIAGLRLEYEF